eukprot:1461208-Lingulodinium_polyedra.AAC.1
MADYTAITSGASGVMSHGCELWYCIPKPVFIDAREVFLQPKHFSLFHASPTLLVVSVQVHAVCFDLVVGHAPPSAEKLR